MKTVVRMKFGSHLYGTNTPQSDTDYKGVHIPDAKDILLQRVKDEVVVGGRQKAEGERNQSTDTDDKSYSLQKFLKLAAEGQTVAIDMLFAPIEMIEERNFLWVYLQLNRNKLLTKKSAAFLGYCRQQADKYGIKGSRVLAAEVAEKFFSDLMLRAPLYRIKVGEYDTEMTALASEHPEHLKIVEKENVPGKFEKFFECCGRKIPYTSGVHVGWETCNRVHDEYGDRARRAKTNEGVDWKALSHAVRVGQEAVELLTTGHVTLPLTNADEIKSIKLGQVPYQAVSEKIEDLLVRVEEAAKTSTLPDDVDHDFIEKVTESAYVNYVVDTYQ